MPDLPDAGHPLQTDAPLKRGIFPKGGIRMVENSLEAYGYHLDPMTKEIFTKYRKTPVSYTHLDVYKRQ